MNKHKSFLPTKLLPWLLPPELIPLLFLLGKYYKYSQYGCLINSIIFHQGELGEEEKEEGGNEEGV